MQRTEDVSTVDKNCLDHASRRVRPKERPEYTIFGLGVWSGHGRKSRSRLIYRHKKADHFPNFSPRPRVLSEKEEDRCNGDDGTALPRMLYAPHVSAKEVASGMDDGSGRVWTEENAIWTPLDRACIPQRYMFN